MSLLQAHHISKYYGSQEIFSDITVTLNPNETYGLIGRNGSGKTTLLKVLQGLEPPTEGNIVRPDRIKIGYAAQIKGFDSEMTVRTAMLAPYAPIIDTLRRAEEALSETSTGTADSRSQERLLREYERARDEFEATGGYELEARVGASLELLGLGGFEERKVHTLSGGERTRVEVASAVLPRPDLLILDEPDNHLDYAGQAWLETFLREYTAGILIVSHDRYLLDRICTRVLEMERGSLTEYAGGYSDYRLRKLRKAVADQAQYTVQQDKIHRLEELVKRFREYARRTADPAWGKRLRARMTQLAKTKERSIDKPELNDRVINVDLQAEAAKAHIALRVRGYSRGIGDTTLYEDAELLIQGGEKAALLGPNGCGKTTFVRDVVQTGTWENPTLQVGPSFRIGYLAQKPEGFDADLTVEERVRSWGPLTKDDALAILRPYLFEFDDLSKRIGDLSGGELNRLQLAEIVYRRADFLILDEPTNHLDIASRETFEDALAGFRGTMLVISHDRYFLAKTTERVVIVDGGGFFDWPGEPGEYFRYMTLQAREGRRSTGGEAPASGADTQAGEATDRRKNHRTGQPVDNRVERQIEEAEQERDRLETAIEKAFAAGDHVQGRTLATRLEKLAKRIEELYESWE